MQKRENVWNQLLNDNKRTQQFQNKNVFILGRKGCGKRTLVDSLSEISKTTYPRNTQLAGKLKIMGLSPLLDYTYLNVVDLKDPEYATNARLNIYILEDESNRQFFCFLKIPSIFFYFSQIMQQVFKPKDSLVVIALDMCEPWTFMEDLDKWIRVVQECMQNSGISMDELKELKQSFGVQDKDITIIGVPIIVTVNKSDILESDDKGKDWDNKFEIIRFHLRQYCVNFYAALMFTSVKTKTNLELFYHYILHKFYKQEINYKADLMNMESIYVPPESDSRDSLKSTMGKYYNQESRYSEIVQEIQTKKLLKEEIKVEDDQEFLQKTKQLSTVKQPSAPPQPKEQQIQDDSQSAQSTKGALNDFYSRILNQPPGGTGPREQAKQQLEQKMQQRPQTQIQPRQSALFNDDDQQKIKNIINSAQPQDSQRGDAKNKIQQILNSSRKNQ